MTGFQMRTSGDEHNYYVKCAIDTPKANLKNKFIPLVTKAVLLTKYFC